MQIHTTIHLSQEETELFLKLQASTGVTVDELRHRLANKLFEDTAQIITDKNGRAEVLKKIER